MTERTYATPPAGLPSQDRRTMDRAVFKNAYALLPADVQRDIVTTRLPHWNNTRAWVLARPLTGFAETFAQYIMEVGPGGGSDKPEPVAEAEGALFVLEGNPTITLDGKEQALRPGHFVFISPESDWTLHNHGDSAATFQWIRKRYNYVEGISAPASLISHDDDVEPSAMPDCNGAWATTRFVDPDDISHDMHVTIVTLQPGAVIPFSETHVMEHGLYVLQGRGIYQLNEDWVEVEAGDFMWLRAFCPQAGYAAGQQPFRYLLYKDMHRHPSLFQL